MSELDLLADCLKDATKERDELAAALDQKDVQIEDLEETLFKIMDLADKALAPAGGSDPCAHATTTWDDRQMERCLDCGEWLEAVGDSKPCAHEWSYVDVAHCSLCGITSLENPCKHASVTAANFGFYNCNDCGMSFSSRPQTVPGRGNDDE